MRFHRLSLLFALSLSLMAPVHAQKTQSSEPYRDRVRREGPVMELSVQDALELALRNNLGITIEQTYLETALQRAIAARAFYDPTASLSLSKGASRSVYIQPSAYAPFDPFSASRTSGFTPSLGFNLFTGGSLTTSLSNSRYFRSPYGPILNPTFGSTLSFDFAQPLLRGAFAGNGGRHQIRIADYDTRIARGSFRQRVISVVQQVLSQYFEFLFAIENYEAKRQSRDLAAVHFENTRLRVQSGILAASALTAARSGVMWREQDWIQSEVQIVNAQNALRVLLSADRSAAVWKASLVPTAAPDARDPAMTLDQALASARSQRPEIEIVQLQREENLENTRFAANQRLPQVNLRASFTSAGQSGVALQPMPEGIDPAAMDYVGGYGTSIGQSFRFNAPGWSVGLNVQLPIRNRALEVQLAQSRIADRRLQAQAQSTLLAVETNVMSAWETLRIQKNSVKAAKLAHEAAGAQVEAITARFQADLATNFEVLGYQRDLADAQVRELRAIIDYQQAFNALLVASGTLLEANGVVLPKK